MVEDKKSLCIGRKLIKKWDEDKEKGEP